MCLFGFLTIAILNFCFQFTWTRTNKMSMNFFFQFFCFFAFERRWWLLIKFKRVLLHRRKILNQWEELTRLPGSARGVCKQVELRVGLNIQLLFYSSNLYFSILLANRNFKMAQSYHKTLKIKSNRNKGEFKYSFTYKIFASRKSIVCLFFPAAIPPQNQTLKKKTF